MNNVKDLIKTIYRGVLSDAARQRIRRLRGKAKREARGLAGSLTARCHVCRSRNVSRYKNRAADHLEFALFICRDCGFIFVHPTPDLTSVYSDKEVPELGDGAHIWNTYFLQAINQHAPHHGKLLEIGFGDASFLKLAHEDGWQVHGLDLSPLSVQHASEKLKLPNVKKGDIEELNYPDNTFDVIAAFNYIEHVPDPKVTLGHIRRILRPGGILALLCPNLSGLYHLIAPEIFGGSDPLNISWVPPMHLSYFNKDNFRRLLENNGFKVIADESHLSSYLWLQHQVTIGPEVTEAKIERLIVEGESLKESGAEKGLRHFRARLVTLLRERMLWGMAVDLMRLEPALGAENAVLYFSQKPEALKEIAVR